MESEGDALTKALLLHPDDESLVLNRDFVPVPRDGFCDPDDTETRESERFRPLKTLALVSCYTAALGVYIAVQTVYIFVSWSQDQDSGPSKLEGGVERPTNGDHEDEETEMILAASLHVPLLVLAGVMEGMIRLAHRRRQSLGYLEFYRQTKKLLPIPFQTAAYSVAALLLLQAWSDRSPNGSPRLWILAICVLEGLVIAVFDILYVRRVLRHNRKEMSPDAGKYLHLPLTDIPDTRRRRRDVVFDNQVEVIRYLQKQRGDLRAEIVRLRESMSAAHGTLDAEIPTDDQKYLMASGEQRIRALKAEVETLKRESETARERFMERTEDAQQLQLLLERQRKENQRLREALEEWSRSNARLESKLNKALGREQTSDRPSTSQGRI